MANMGQSCYLPLWLFSATLDFTYFKRLANIPSLCMYVCMHVVCVDKVAGKRPTWLPKAAAQADMIIISILYTSITCSAGGCGWIVNEWIVNGCGSDTLIRHFIHMTGPQLSNQEETCQQSQSPKPAGYGLLTHLLALPKQNICQILDYLYERNGVFCCTCRLGRVGGDP